MNQKLIESATCNLVQLKQAMMQIPVGMYEQGLDILSGSSIGMHVRHIVEFYQCMIIGNELGTIDYDGRQRNLRIESELNYAISVIEECEFNLLKINDNKMLVLLTTQSLDTEVAEIPTNTYRELTYLIEHTIHHMAIVKMAFKCHCPQVELSNQFGVAYSTIKYQEFVHSNLSAD